MGGRRSEETRQSWVLVVVVPDSSCGVYRRAQALQARLKACAANSTVGWSLSPAVCRDTCVSHSLLERCIPVEACSCPHRCCCCPTWSTTQVYDRAVVESVRAWVEEEMARLARVKELRAEELWIQVVRMKRLLEWCWVCMHDYLLTREGMTGCRWHGSSGTQGPSRALGSH